MLSADDVDVEVDAAVEECSWLLEAEYGQESLSCLSKSRDW